MITRGIKEDRSKTFYSVLHIFGKFQKYNFSTNVYIYYTSLAFDYDIAIKL